MILIKRLFNFAFQLVNGMEFNDKQIQIIETAERLFAERGFDGTSVRDIADEAGINVAMISYYFGSKEKLMEALFELRVGSVKLRMENLIKDDSLSPIEKVNMLIDEHIERVMLKPCFQKVMQGVLVTNKNPAILKAANNVKLRSIAVVAELIKDGQKKGVFKKKIDVVLMLNTMVGTASQSLMSMEYYREFNNQQDLPDEEFKNIFKRRLSIHIKTLFKVILTNEA
ncbi:TetR family transcriptional regulator [Ferruginibacter paludis]|uniref:TetR/AcrR family transcriptional regulator n=2 Tax=Ferruginibacter TaxID=1004303 RepID=UPI0025B502B3|nr:TetR/AcrR family transcriptional regulator [Ferruginibacter paludis]MDB5276899.1 TetR/AcrR family transcriptional regulator [Ferruginibacter sp.]MDN3659321.1 TetR family transcriptional regulator [Ferruginibacter paludis]